MNFNTLKSLVKRRTTTTLSAVLLIAAPLTAQHEGLRLKAYLDPVGIPTICYGETEGVALSIVKTHAECDKMLVIKLGAIAIALQGIVVYRMSPEMHAALSSFVYNVGFGKFKSSTLLRLLNAGDVQGACDQLPRWVYAKGIKLPGLIVRREEERKLCLHGLVQTPG